MFSSRHFFMYRHLYIYPLWKWFLHIKLGKSVSLIEVQFFNLPVYELVPTLTPNGSKINVNETRNSVIFQIDVAESSFMTSFVLLCHLIHFNSIDTLCFYWSKFMSRLDTLYFYWSNVSQNLHKLVNQRSLGVLADTLINKLTLTSQQKGYRYNALHFLYSNTPNTERTWIGLHQTTGQNLDLQWIDGSTDFVFDNASFYQPWASGEPDGDDDPCVHIRHNSGYLWGDSYCGNTYWSMCESTAQPSGYL